MPYVDLAKKPSSGPEEAKPMSQQPYYPSFHLDLPEAPDLKLNTEIEAKVKLKLKGVRQDMMSGKKNVCLDFDVMAIDLGSTKKKNSSEEDLAEALSADQKELDRD